MLAENEPLEPRHQLYYGRELFYHQKYQETADVLEAFLEEPDAWTENRIDACMILGQCYDKIGKKERALEAFLYSLTMDIPRAEICCEIGKIFLERSGTDRPLTGTVRHLPLLLKKRRGDFL